MELTPFLVPLVSGIIGWALRHYGYVVPAGASPQTRPASGGTVSPSPVSADLPSMLASIVSEEVRKGVAYLEGRLLPMQPAPQTPQTGRAA